MWFDALIDSYLGNTAKHLREVFAYAEGHPCVLFIDECDAIATSREQGNDTGEMVRVVNCLLQALDRPPGEGLLVAATNLPSALDRALWRRFDHVVSFALPNEAAREQFLRTRLAGTPHDATLPKEWARRAAHCTLADLDRWVNRARIARILDGIPRLTEDVLLAYPHTSSTESP